MPWQWMGGRTMSTWSPLVAVLSGLVCRKNPWSSGWNNNHAARCELSLCIVGFFPFTQTAANLKIFLQKCVTLVQSVECRVIAIVSDNASNISKAIGDLAVETGVIRLNCLAHSAELLVKSFTSIHTSPFLYFPPPLSCRYLAVSI